MPLAEFLCSFMNPIIIIPARLAATRLPNKPLADIAGKPMIARVIERAKLSNIKNILVACGDVEIIAPSEQEGAIAILTDPALPSGSDRVLAAINEYDPQKKYDVIINLQGDMPTFAPQLINDVLGVLQKYKDADIATLLSPSDNEDEKNDENVVKGIISLIDEYSGKCLYFTRANAPWGAQYIYRHVGIYAFRRQALEKFVSLQQSLLEKTEKLEQLRALENNMNIYAALVEEFPKGVDTQAHLEMARQFYENRSNI